MQKKNMNSPDETRLFDKGKAEIITLRNLLLFGLQWIFCCSILQYYLQLITK